MGRLDLPDPHRDEDEEEPAPSALQVLQEAADAEFGDSEPKLPPAA